MSEQLTKLRELIREDIQYAVEETLKANMQVIMNGFLPSVMEHIGRNLMIRFDTTPSTYNGMLADTITLSAQLAGSSAVGSFTIPSQQMIQETVRNQMSTIEYTLRGQLMHELAEQVLNRFPLESNECKD